MTYVERLSIAGERLSQIHVCSSSVLVGLLTLFACVAIVSARLHIAASDVLPFHGLQFVRNVWATSASRRCHRLFCPGSRPRRARRVINMHISSVSSLDAHGSRTLLCAMFRHCLHVIACEHGVLNSFATNITAMCAQYSHVIAVIAFVCRGSDPLLLL